MNCRKTQPFIPHTLIYIIIPVILVINKYLKDDDEGLVITVLVIGLNEDNCN